MPKRESNYRDDFEEKVFIIKNDGSNEADLNQLLEDKWSPCCMVSFDGGVLVHLERKLP